MYLVYKIEWKLLTSVSVFVFSIRNVCIEKQIPKNLKFYMKITENNFISKYYAGKNRTKAKFISMYDEDFLGKNEFFKSSFCK